jgi:hypothetical protein
MKSCVFVNVIMEWTALSATAAMITAPHVFATATFASIATLSPTDVQGETTAGATAMRPTVATGVRAAAGVNATTAWIATAPAESVAIIAIAVVTNLVRTAPADMLPGVKTTTRTTAGAAVMNVSIATTVRPIAIAIVMNAAVTAWNAIVNVMVVTIVIQAVTTVVASVMNVARTATTTTPVRMKVPIINRRQTKFSGFQSGSRMHWEFNYPLRKLIRSTAPGSKQPHIPTGR